ncbi:hypothetical protein pdam_00021653 [Pocillopora damicornis]|uniref:Fibroblast growth factor n=2 Tax=Pocillopora damicornis TaxID=46731 RepID=A0A3M6TIZ1_POCDA|nr:hypothetical protein pdam_00021653 [Pocillopora damicornis]
MSSNRHATLTMESVKTAEVMLRGNVSGNYIAMNTKGELYSTNSPTHPECVFKEIFGTKCNSYQSTLNPAWYLALTKQGEAKYGPKTKPGQRAVGFIAE